MAYDAGKPGPGLRQEQKCDRVKLFNGILTIPFKNCISNGNTDIIKWWSPVQIRFLYKRPQTITKMSADEVRFVLDQHAKLDFYSASSLKQTTVCG
jgi:hypothetical protein